MVVKGSTGSLVRGRVLVLLLGCCRVLLGFDVNDLGLGLGV